MEWLGKYIEQHHDARDVNSNDEFGASRHKSSAVLFPARDANAVVSEEHSESTRDGRLRIAFGKPGSSLRITTRWNSRNNAAVFISSLILLLLPRPLFF